MTSRHNFRNLKIWQFGMDLVNKVYDFTKTMPKEEQYGLTSQINRLAVAVPSNIAEGSAKISNKDFARFTGISLGSAFECETQLLISQRRGFGDQDLLIEAVDMLHEEQRMLVSFQNKLRSSATSILLFLFSFLSTIAGIHTATSLLKFQA